MDSNQPFVIEWKRLRDVDKKYDRSIAHFPGGDPLKGMAAVLSDGRIVGVYWTSSKGIYTQMLCGPEKQRPVCGPFTEGEARAWVDAQWIGLLSTLAPQTI